MKLWTCTKFKGAQPTGAAAIVIASDKEQAAKLLEELLTTQGLRQRIDTNMLERVSMTTPKAVVLFNGDY